MLASFSGGGEIRTLGRRYRRQRFSRPPRSTAPAPLQAVEMIGAGRVFAPDRPGAYAALRTRCATDAPGRSRRVISAVLDVPLRAADSGPAIFQENVETVARLYNDWWGLGKLELVPEVL